MWEIGINNQAVTFLFSALLGFGLSFLYDLFKIIRRVARPKKIVVFILDIIYFLIITVIFFCFLMLRTNGELRIYTFVGAALGFLLFYITFSKVMLLLVRPITKICEFFKNILKFALKPLEELRKIVYNRHIKIKRKLKHCQPKKAREKVSY